MLKTATLILIVLLSICCSHCVRKEGGYKIPYPVAAGSVIGKEICYTNETEDYWLINFDTAYHYGDTLTYQGVFYENVVKTNQLLPEIKKIGIRLFVGFEISSNKVISNNCQVSSSQTYSLHVLLKLFRQGKLCC